MDQETLKSTPKFKAERTPDSERAEYQPTKNSEHNNTDTTAVSKAEPAVGSEVSREPTNKEKMLRAQTLLSTAEGKVGSLELSREQNPSDQTVEIDLAVVKLEVGNLKTYIEYVRAGNPPNWKMDCNIGLPV